MLILPRELPLEIKRKFYLSRYLASHSQLLLRSDRDGYHAGQRLQQEGSVFDVLFKGVAAVALADEYYPLKVSLGTADDAMRLRDLLRCDTANRRLYVLEGAVSRGYVLAGALYWIDDPNGSDSADSILLGTPDRTRDIEVYSA